MEIGSSTFGLCPNNKSIDKTIEEIVEASSNFVTRNSHGVMVLIEMHQQVNLFMRMILLSSRR